MYSDRETQYQIHVEFAEIGLKVDGEVWKPDNITSGNDNGISRNRSEVATVMSVTKGDKKTPVEYNTDSGLPNLSFEDIINITIGQSSSQDCIYEASSIKWKNVKGSKKYYKGTDEQDTVHLNTFVGKDKETPFIPLGATSTLGEFSGFNYDIQIKTFPPNFYVKSQDMGAYGDISQGHVLADGWNKEENNRTIISQNRFGSAPNEISTCGFINSYQQVNIAPKKMTFIISTILREPM